MTHHSMTRPTAPYGYASSTQNGFIEETIDLAPGTYGRRGPEKGCLIGAGKTSSSLEPSQHEHEIYDRLPEHPPALNIFARVYRKIGYAVLYCITVLLIGLPLAILVVLFNADKQNQIEAASDRQFQNLVYYVALWLLVTWGSAVGFNIFAHLIPHIFRGIATYVNPAHRKYWRVLKAMKKPITFVGCAIVCFVAFTDLINFNELLVVNYQKDYSILGWDDIIADILQNISIWVCMYLLEKMLVLYISIHYHYGSDRDRITRSKQIHNALVTLYEASIYLHPIDKKAFRIEDSVIRNNKATGPPRQSVLDASKFLSKLGIDGKKKKNFFGTFKQSEQESHWMKPNGSYAIVERALGHPRSAAALAKRIWMSLVPNNKDMLTAEDIADVLGPHSREEAQDLFKILDENDSGDITLNEMVWTVIEAGRIRHAIYSGMHDINRAINVFDWICLLIIGFTMVSFILITYVPTIKSIKDTLALAALGIGFAAGRTFQKFLGGAIFLFFDHAYDVGDRVEVYNMQSKVAVPSIVTRISILYTVFTRMDDGKNVQIANDRLALVQIVNITRSGLNREERSIFVDFKTSFQDIRYLQNELEAFLSHKDNAREYVAGLELQIVDIHDMNKMELKCSFTHKSNWSNEKLRMARSSKFMCALIAAIRKIPINKPGGANPALGDEGKPAYTVMISEEDAEKKRKADKKTKKEARMDFVKSAAGDSSTAQGDKLSAGSDKASNSVPRKLTEEDRQKLESEAKEAVSKEKVATEAEAARAAAKVAEDVAHESFALIPNELEGHSSHTAGITSAVEAGVASLITRVSTGLRVKGPSGHEAMFYR